MKAIIYDNLNDLNKFLATSKTAKVDYRMAVVGEEKDKNGMKKYQIVDRFFVIES